MCAFKHDGQQRQTNEKIIAYTVSFTLKCKCSIFKHLLVLLLCIILCSAQVTSGHIYTNEFAVQISGGDQVANRVARSHGFVNKGQVGNLKGFYVLEHHKIHKRSSNFSSEHHNRLSNDPAVLWVEQQHIKHRVKRDIYSDEQTQVTEQEYPDPLYSEQWFLHGGGHGGYDMNVLPAWKLGYTGKGVVVSILDDGIQTNHPDLIQNYDKQASFDINGQDDDPMPQDDGDNKHGTRCAGEVAAMAFNEFCGVGVAYNASIGGVRMLDGTVTDVTEATALSHNPDHIDIYSASWGPEDDGKTVDGPGPLAKQAFTDGIAGGRNGLGSIFVWASGNGGRYGDSCNCDGYTNSIYTLSISSATQAGTMPWYLEQCSSTLATTYSSGTINKDKSIVTVDMDMSYFKDLRRNRIPNPENLCTKCHTGTSASAPIAAAICALALEANPKLTWRDMQHLVLMTSRSGPLEREDGWVKNGVGRQISSKFGYGLMDAFAIVKLAKQWTTVPPQHICETPPDSNERIIPNTSGGHVEASMYTSGCLNTNNAIAFLEHVQVKVTLHFKPRGNLKIILISPSGTPSTVLLPRPNDKQDGSFNNWPFMSVHFWGEKAEGNWKIIIINDGINESPQAGKLVQWSLVLYGTETNPINLKHQKRTEYRSPELVGSRHYNYPVPYVNDIDENTGNPCFQNKQFLNKDTPDGQCVTVCPLGQYGDRKSYACNLCDNSCRTCYGPSYNNCLSCQVKTFLFKDMCSKSCPDGFYADKEYQECLPCAELCATCCSNRNYCLTCKPKLFLNEQHCLPVCPLHTFPNNSVCERCDYSCLSCKGPSRNDCLHCAVGYFLYNRSCYPTCPDGYYANSDRECQRCDVSCKNCTDELMCQTCQDKWEKTSSGLCVYNSKCKKGWQVEANYLDEIECKPCSEHCKHCSGSKVDQCTLCEDGFYLVENQCISTCPPGTYGDSGKCASCYGLCNKCSDGEQGMCLACQKGLVLHNGNCIVNCPERTYDNGQHMCHPCHSTCAHCTGKTNNDCTSCHPDSYLLNGTCYSSCPHGFYSLLDMECVPCYGLCKTCKGVGPESCESCHNNSTLVDGTCIPCLDDEYFDRENKNCERCHDNCGRCSGPTEFDCLSCQAPKRLDKDKHQCLPCCSDVASKNLKCCTCSKDLDVCVNSGDHPRSIHGVSYDLDGSNELIIPMKDVVHIVVAICASAVLLFVLVFGILQASSYGWCQRKFRGKQYERVPNLLAARFDTEMEKVSLTQDDPDEEDDIYEKA